MDTKMLVLKSCIVLFTLLMSLDCSAVGPESVKNKPGILPQPTPNSTTVTPTTKVPPTTSTTPAPTSSKATTPTTPATTPTTRSPPPTTHVPNTTTPAPSTTPAPPTTPKPTPAPTPAPDNHKFDGPSFIGGIVLTIGLLAIGFVSYKFYMARTNQSYHTL